VNSRNPRTFQSQKSTIIIKQSKGNNNYHIIKEEHELIETRSKKKNNFIEKPKQRLKIYQEEESLHEEDESKPGFQRSVSEEGSKDRCG